MGPESLGADAGTVSEESNPLDIRHNPVRKGSECAEADTVFAFILETAAAEQGDSEMDTYERVKRILVQVLNLVEDEVTPDASIGDDLGADSMDAVELSVALEKEFGGQVHDEEAQMGPIEMLPETTVQQVVNYVESRIGKNG